MQKRVCLALFVQALISPIGLQSKKKKKKCEARAEPRLPAACVKRGVGSLLSPASVIDCRFPRLVGAAVTALRGAAHVSELTTPSSQVTQAQLQEGCGPSFRHRRAP